MLHVATIKAQGGVDLWNNRIKHAHSFGMRFPVRFLIVKLQLILDSVQDIIIHGGLPVNVALLLSKLFPLSIRQIL